MPNSIKPLRTEGNIAYISLSRGYEAIIDLADIPLVGCCNWNAVVDRHTVYAKRTFTQDGKRRTVLLHRIIMGEPDGLTVDHIDGNGLNNRRSNLRLATKSENASNQRIAITNTSGFKGVCWSKSTRKWMAQIQARRQRKCLGFYDTPEEAHAAYCKASAELHGEFGRTA